MIMNNIVKTEDMKIEELKSKSFNFKVKRIVYIVSHIEGVWEDAFEYPLGVFYSEKEAIEFKDMYDKLMEEKKKNLKEEDEEYWDHKDIFPCKIEESVIYSKKN